MAEDAEILGLPLPPAADPEHCLVLPENWLALQIFLQCQTQWRVIAGMGSAFYQGLDYPSVIAVLHLQAPAKKRRKLFRKIQLIEQGALSCINDKE